MLRTLIVDDEAPARSYLRRLLSSHTDFEIVGEASQGNESVGMIESLHPDVLFLDVQMPELDGFGVLNRLNPGNLPPIIVFVTAYDAHALKAFEARALDYLLKPFDDLRFGQCLERVRAHWRGVQAGEGTSQILALLEGIRPAAYAERLTVKLKDSVLVLHVNDVDWISADDNYVRVHAHGEEYLLRESLSRLEARLNPAVFQRIHRSTVVNLLRIRTLDPLFHGEYQVTLSTGQQLVLSRRHKAQLEAVLGKF